MQVSDFDYELPPELIAQRPCPERDGSRMMTMGRRSGACQTHPFSKFPDFLRPDDCLVLNDTKVIPARLFGRKESGGGQVEALLLERTGPGRWQALLRPGRRLKPSARVRLDGGDFFYTVKEKTPDGRFALEFSTPDVLEMLQQQGATPLPPYLHRAADESDVERYQTVYARHPGAVAAPTAGLHFTDAMLRSIEAQGTRLATVTLHVGQGTFQPVAATRVEEHVMHAESFTLSPAAADVVNDCRRRGGRIVAVGTTSVRVLESCTDAGGTVVPRQGQTRLFMHPPDEPRAVDVLLTNFHLPRSTLLMLVSCFSSREQVLAAYRRAIAERLRFYSYGDCMLLL